MSQLKNISSLIIMGILLIWYMIWSSRYVHGATLFNRFYNTSKCILEDDGRNYTLKPGVVWNISPKDCMQCSCVAMDLEMITECGTCGMVVLPCPTVNNKALYPNCSYTLREHIITKYRRRILLLVFSPKFSFH
ncbi:unnamed protein product [Gordionus sp. m RMFG-2023]